MKLAVLTFSYANGFDHFATELKEKGSYTVNLGDFIQSWAVEKLLKSLGVKQKEMVYVDRDTLPAYQGQKVALVMNGCFYKHCFPIPPTIQPIFVGFNLDDEEVASRYREYFKRYEPIGCRDLNTVDILKKQGVEAYLSGCLSIMLPRRWWPPLQKKIFLIEGGGLSVLPSGFERYLPPEYQGRIVRQFQREETQQHPLSFKEMQRMRAKAIELLAKYKKEASLVITPLLHAASPCAGMGIPTVLLRGQRNARFSGLERYLRLYLPEDLPLVDWAPRPLGLEDIKDALRLNLKKAITVRPLIDCNRC